jgi:hypothetical protein
MKHLKRFNENKVDRNDLMSFIKEYLAFILDSGFEIEIHIEADDDGNDLYCVTIFKGGEGSDELLNYFKWDDVSYDMIPFFEILSKKFPVFGDVYFNTEKGVEYFKIKDIINTDIEFVEALHSIEFYIKTD